MTVIMTGTEGQMKINTDRWQETCKIKSLVIPISPCVHHQGLDWKKDISALPKKTGGTREGSEHTRLSLKRPGFVCRNNRKPLPRWAAFLLEQEEISHRPVRRQKKTKQKILPSSF